jgi:threonine aldolase
MGTVYSVSEIKKLTDFAHGKGMMVHMDGARLANAAASLGVGLRQITSDCGVDALSFGGTKNGIMGGEAVVLFKKDLFEGFQYRRKQAMQLASKMRFIAVQFEALLENDLWLRSATHANRMAQFLVRELEGIPEVQITQKVQANGVFARVPKQIIPILLKDYFFYVWNEAISEVRWMASFDTTEDDVGQFVAKIKTLL